MSPYARGRQPCANYSPQEADIPGARGMANVHECFGPYDGRPGGDGCAGTVSFCLTCHCDHHAGGWETCPTPKPKENDDA